MAKKQTGIDTWRWRIAKAGHTARSFARYCEVNNALISQYVNGKIVPTPERIEHIEASLRELGV